VEAMNEASEVSKTAAVPVMTTAPAVPEVPRRRGPSGEPGSRQHKPGMQLKRAHYSSGKRTSLKTFARKHRPELYAMWMKNKRG
jgi:hypothetical protein